MKSSTYYLFFAQFLLIASGQFNCSNEYSTYCTELTNIDNNYFLANISLGTPPQNFSVQINTNSNILWVPTSLCYGCQMNQRFQPSQSTTMIASSSNSFTIDYLEYPNAFCTGIMFTDDFQIQSFSPPSTSITFLGASQEAGFPSSFSGIMGLSNNQTYQNIFTKYQTVQNLESSTFQINLQYTPLNSYLFYDINEQVFNNVTCISCISKSAWELSISSISFDQNVYTSQVTYGILDTSSPNLLIPQSLYNILNSNYLSPNGCQVISTGSIQIYCNNGASSLPTITINFALQSGGTQSVTIPATNFFPYNDSPYVNIGVTSESGLIVLGVPFFVSTAPIFNQNGNCIGLPQ